MKLRLLSLETNETIRIEIADSSSLLDLKTLIAGKLSSSSTSLISPQSIALSLNRRDELVASSPNDSLLSIGLTPGDLLLYARTQTLTPVPISHSSAIVNGSSSSPMNVEPKTEAHSVEKSAAETLSLIPKSEITKSGPTIESNENKDADMKIEPPSMEKSYPVCCFLRRVMDLEREGIKDNLGFLVVAVHAVFLESGFAVCNEDISRLPQNWNSAPTGVAVRYTVPELLAQLQEGSVKAATLKFSVMGNHVSVYGNLSGEADFYRLHLDLSEVVPLLVFLSGTVKHKEETGVFKFWQNVKDRLCFPLLIDSCKKNGLQLPPCFDRLPTDLKFKILELLPGVDIARIGCTSSEMRLLTMSEDLWKQKVMEEYFRPVNVRVRSSMSSWKDEFKRLWVTRKDLIHLEKMIMRHMQVRDMQEDSRPSTAVIPMPMYPVLPRTRFPFVGGDNDQFPAIVDFGPMWPGFGYPGSSVRWNFPHQCNLCGWLH